MSNNTIQKSNPILNQSPKQGRNQNLKQNHHLRQLINALFLLFYMNLPILATSWKMWLVLQIPIYLLGAVGLILLLVFADGSEGQVKRSSALFKGNALLRLFLITLTIQVIIGIGQIVYLCSTTLDAVIIGSRIWWLVLTFLVECLVFWTGMLRIYCTSVQLGIKWRVIGLLMGWIPILNLIALHRMMQITRNEAEFEDEKFLLDRQRAATQICHTKYPVLLVHGVFFRDFHYLNYWGRIPRALKANGAVLYYGQQQSAETVEQCGKELAARIREIVAESGCEKVNIIAHSKGGLDSRWAISCEEMAPYVASLTTINTPHRGCIFADELLHKIPVSIQKKVAKTYNGTLRRLGDRAPDFLAAVWDLTHSRCTELDQKMPDAKGVMYQSVMSYVDHASGGKFPLNVAYPLVKHYDGKNDGLVSVESGLKWKRQISLAPVGKRGISHGDMIDLNRENIGGFDVREFYVKLVSELASEGY